jgi:hypothetical protein
MAGQSFVDESLADSLQRNGLPPSGASIELRLRVEAPPTYKPRKLSKSDTASQMVAAFILASGVKRFGSWRFASASVAPSDRHCIV